jgi:ribosomal protein L37AE/L43A
MKKRLLPIFFAILLLIGTLSLEFTAYAVETGDNLLSNNTLKPLDFGDQNDYDSGDSDWGSSDYDSDSSWDNDNYYSSDSGSNNGDFTAFDFVVAAVIIIVVIVALPVLSKKKGKKSTQTGSTVMQKAGRNVALPDRTNEISQIIKQYDPDFSAEDFNAFARYVYVAIQDAWSKRDLTPVRIYLHDNLYNQTQQQVENKKARGVINKIENVAVSTAYLTAYRRDKNLEFVTVYLNARLTDYEINETTGAVLRGDPNARYELRYALRFVRNNGVKTNEVNKDLIAHNCPNCGAPLEMSNSGKCEYCDSVITTGAYTWVLCEYSSIRNDFIDQGIYLEPDNKN